MTPAALVALLQYVKRRPCGVTTRAARARRASPRLSGVSRETLARLEAYAELLPRWSARINLVGRDTLADLWRRHFLNSAQLLPLRRPRHEEPDRSRQRRRVSRAGAGDPRRAGVELVEADARKCAFLREAARIAAAPVTIHNCRIAAVPPHSVDVVTARAFAPLDRLLDLAQPFIGPSTVCLFPKGERAGEELTLARKRWTMAVVTAQQHCRSAGGRSVFAAGRP